MQGMALTNEQRDEVRAALKQAGFLAHDPAVGASFIDFVKGQLYHLLEERDLALLHLERAFGDEDFRRRYALSLFQALAAELVWAGRVEEAREYARLVGGEVGQETHFLRIVEAQLRP
jgi:tetratricopeptide (TPR) repeat protein